MQGVRLGRLPAGSSGVWYGKSHAVVAHCYSLPCAPCRWAELKPSLALHYPFELDTFQKEAIIHMEVVATIGCQTVVCAAGCVWKKLCSSVCCRMG